MEPSEIEKNKAQSFLKEYRKLCEKHELRIVITPAFVARDDGSWSIVLQTSVGTLPKQASAEKTEE
mgnify:CR=1